jgi:hypothetical protein
MKRLIVTAGSTFFFLLFQHQITFAQATAPGYHAELASITDRVNGGDASALLEANKLPPPAAVPYLVWWAKLNRTPQEKEIAVGALGARQEDINYIQNELEAATAKGDMLVDDFEILGLIDTPQSAAVVAPYLFDFKTNLPQEGDLAGDSNVGEAVYTLARMKLAGAPPPQPDEMSNAAYLVEWQKWAISKGYVPSGWASKIGAPKWMLQLDVAEGLTHTPVAAVTANPPRIISSAAAALPSPSVPTNTAASSPMPPILEIQGTGSAFHLLTAVALVLFIIGGILVWKKRS